MLVGKVNRICHIYSDTSHRWMSTLFTAKYVRSASFEQVPSLELLKYNTSEISTVSRKRNAFVIQIKGSATKMVAF